MTIGTPRTITAQAQSAPTLADRAARFLIRRRRHVMLAWLIAIMIAVPLAVTVKGALSGAGWNAEGSQSAQVDTELRRVFPSVGADDAIVVVQAATPAITRADAQTLVRSLAGQPEAAQITDPYTVPASTGLVSSDRRTVMIPVRLAASQDAQLVKQAGAVSAAVARASLPGGGKAYVTGQWPMWADFNQSNDKAMLSAELLSGIPTMILLVIVFGSLIAAGLPMLLAMGGIALGYAGLHLLTGATPLSVWSMNFSMMMGMAVGIDYSLFILTRYRAERAAGREMHAALATTLATSGKAVFLSATTVVLALAAIFLLPVMVFRSMALGMLLSVAVVATAALTLLPAILAGLGDRVLRGRGNTNRRSQALWTRWAGAVVRRPVRGLLAGLVLLLALAAPVLGVRLGMPGPHVVDTGYSSRDGYDVMERAFGPGTGASVYIIAPSTEADALARTAATYPDVAGAAPIAESASTGSSVIRVTPTSAIDDPRTASLVAGLRQSVHQQYPSALIGGPAAQNYDMTQALAASAPWIIALVLGASLLLMLIVFRSIAIAAVSLLMNLLTLGAAFGIAALVFQHGIGASIIGIDPQGLIDAWAPVFFFALLFGLSMDYQLFLLAAIRERYEVTGDTKRAVREAIAATGRPITNAAIIMVIVFLAFGVTGPIPPTELGITMAIGVILDATIVRMLAVPATLVLLGRRNWWIPRWLDRILPSFTFRH